MRSPDDGSHGETIRKPEIHETIRIADKMELRNLWSIASKGRQTYLFTASIRLRD